MNYQDESEQEIRAADPIRADCLLPQSEFIPYNIDDDELLNRIIEQSALDYEMQQIALEMIEREERLRHFASIKLKFKQLEKLDKDNAEFYRQFLSYIDSYEKGEIVNVRVEVEFYNKSRRIIDNMRIQPEDKRRILAFIYVVHYESS